MTKEEYNDVPVWFCDTCLSLNILNSSGSEKDIDNDIVPCYCGSCGSTDIANGNIHYVLEAQKTRKRFKK